MALRHYDQFAHSKKDDYLNKRKKFVYEKFRERANDESKKNETIFKQIGERGNYKESDLLFIPIKNLERKPFDEIRSLVIDITDKFSNGWGDLYDGIERIVEEK